MPKGKDYVGEHFMAVWEGSVQGGYAYHICQISPVVHLAKTDSRDMAVELVNRLDVTGDSPVGSDDDAAEAPVTTYRVRVRGKQTVYATIILGADNPQEAESLALDEAPGWADWEVDEETPLEIMDAKALTDS